MALTRLAELLGRLSLAFDISSAFPHGKAVRSTVLAVELGKRAGASDEEIGDTYWVSLLANLGCTGFAHDEGLMGAGDDRSLRSGMSLFSIEDPRVACRCSRESSPTERCSSAFSWRCATRRSVSPRWSARGRVS